MLLSYPPPTMNTIFSARLILLLTSPSFSPEAE